MHMLLISAGLAQGTCAKNDIETRAFGCVYPVAHTSLFCLFSPVVSCASPGGSTYIVCGLYSKDSCRKLNLK